MSKIKCIPLKEVIHFCIMCNQDMPFDSNNHCYACECDGPTGSIDDDELTQEDFDIDRRFIEIIL